MILLSKKFICVYSLKPWITSSIGNTLKNAAYTLKQMCYMTDVSSSLYKMKLTLHFSEKKIQAQTPEQNICVALALCYMK